MVRIGCRLNVVADGCGTRSPVLLEVVVWRAVAPEPCACRPWGPETVSGPPDAKTEGSVVAVASIRLRWAEREPRWRMVERPTVDVMLKSVRPEGELKPG